MKAGCLAVFVTTVEIVRAKEMSWILLKSCRGALRQIPNAIIFQYQYLKYGEASDVDTTQTKHRLYSGGEMEEMLLEPQ